MLCISVEKLNKGIKEFLLKKLKEKVTDGKLRCQFFSFPCRQCQIVHRMLYALTEMQMFAYMDDHYRSLKEILERNLCNILF